MLMLPKELRTSLSLSLFAGAGCRAGRHRGFVKTLEDLE